MRHALLLLALFACSPASETRDAIKQAVGDARTKPRLVIQIRLLAPGYPDAKDLELRRSIEKQIEEQRIGVIVGQEAAPGHMDLTVEVEDTMETIPRIEDILRDAGVRERATIRVAQSAELGPRLIF